MLNFIIKYKTGLLVIGFLLLLQLFTFYTVSQYASLMSQNQLKTLASKINNEIEQSIIDKQRATTALAFALSHDVTRLEISPEKLEHNIEFNSLIAQIKKHSDYKNLGVQIVNKEGSAVYRSWSPFHNKLSNVHPEFNLALQSGDLVKGVASGMFGVVLKTVTPIIQNDQIVGFLDLISHFNSIQHSLETKHIDSIVIATEERSKLITVPFSSHRIGPFYIANLNPNPSLMSSLNEKIVRNWQDRQKNYWLWQDKLVVKHPLKGADNTIHAYVYGMSSIADLTSQTDLFVSLVNKKSFFITADIVISITLLMGLALFYVRAQRQYYHDILNYEEEAVLVTNGEQWVDANSQLFHYFPGLKENDYKCICDFFEKEDGFLQKYMDGVLWIEYLTQQPFKQNKVLVLQNGSRKIFQVKARKLDSPSSLYVAVLTDITTIENLNTQLHVQSLTDELTQVGNRRSFNEALSREIELSKLKGQSLSLISFDIDYFKTVNDSYGHAVGDEVLKSVVQTVHLVLRKTDALFRVGGEEFMVLLSMQNHDEAAIVAEKIRQQIESTHIDTVGQITVSLGVTQMTIDDDQSSLLIRVDRAMYNAKESGRNRVSVV